MATQGGFSQLVLTCQWGTEGQVAFLGLCLLPAPSPWAMWVPSLGPKLLTMGLSRSGPPSLPPVSLQHDPGVLR